MRWSSVVSFPNSLEVWMSGNEARVTLIFSWCFRCSVCSWSLDNSSASLAWAITWLNRTECVKLMDLLLDWSSSLAALAARSNPVGSNPTHLRPSYTKKKCIQIICAILYAAILCYRFDKRMKLVDNIQHIYNDNLSFLNVERFLIILTSTLFTWSFPLITRRGLWFGKSTEKPRHISSYVLTTRGTIKIVIIRIIKAVAKEN